MVILCGSFFHHGIGDQSFFILGAGSENIMIQINSVIKDSNRDSFSWP